MSPLTEAPHTLDQAMEPIRIFRSQLVESLEINFKMFRSLQAV